MRSGPTSFGLSYRIGIPVRTPGSTTRASNPKYRCVMSRSAAVTRGTPPAITTPVTWASNENPWKPRNCGIISASSSSVRSATVAMRQWSASSLPLNRPMTVCVLPASIASSIRRSELPFHVEAEVERGRRLGDRARGDEVGAGGRVLGHVVERDAARDLDKHAGTAAPANELDALLHLRGAHVVEHHDAGAGLDRLRDLLDPLALDLDGAAGPAVARCLHRLVDAQPDQVVVLDEEGVGQGRAVVVPAPGADGGLLERPQPRERLAGVEDPDPSPGGLHELAGRGGDAREVTEDIERGALATEHRAQPSVHAAELGARGEGVAVLVAPRDRDVGVELPVHLGRCKRARQDTFPPGDEPAGAACVLGDDRLRGEVAENAEVLVQRGGDDLAQRTERRIGLAHRAGSRSGSGTRRALFPPSKTKRPRKSDEGSGKSRRVWVPRDSVRARAASTRALLTVTRLRTSGSVTPAMPSSSFAARSKLAASRSTPASRVMTR